MTISDTRQTDVELFILEQLRDAAHRDVLQYEDLAMDRFTCPSQRTVLCMLLTDAKARMHRLRTEIATLRDLLSRDRADGDREAG